MLGGFTVLAVGLLLLILPGPGIPLVILGLVLLSLEFLWAKKLLRKAKSFEKDMEKKIRKRF
jgi:tellurite resistance protein TerC